MQGFVKTIHKVDCMFLFFLWILAQDEPAATDRICCATRPGIERLNPVISRRRMTADRQHGLFIAAVGRNFAKDHRQYCGSAPNPNAQCCKADDRHQTCGHPGRLPLSYLQLKRFPGDGENSFCQSAWDSASASLGHRQCGAESHITWRGRVGQNFHLACVFPSEGKS